MSCASTVWISLKAALLCGTRYNQSYSPTLIEDQVEVIPNTPQSPPDEPASHQFLRRQTTATTTSSFSPSPVPERNRRYTNESLSSIARRPGYRKNGRRHTDESISSKITTFRFNVQRKLTGESDEMSASTFGPRKRKQKGQKSLHNEINAVMVLQKKPDLRFVPEGAWKQLFHKSAVAKILERHYTASDPAFLQLQSFICDRATRVFAILAWADCEAFIEKFHLHGFGDDRLPVHLEVRETDQLIDAVSFYFGNLSLEEHPFNHDEWTEVNLDNFCSHYQWPFVSPVLEEKKFRYNFHEQTHMPFMDEKCRSHKESFFSVVEEWRIHRDHIKMPKFIRIPTNPEEHPTVAVKRLKQMALNDADFEGVVRAEVDALETIRDLNHPHLVNAVAYYTRGKDHYIVFPWARRGNLRDFWKNPPPPLSSRYLEWVFTQLCGLAEAVKTLHFSNKERWIRHGDMKPENILCFDDVSQSDRGHHDHTCRLVVADVGLSRSQDKLTEARKTATRTKGGTIKYEPPETELLPNEPRSRRYDVWSLGCIYLEFAIWLLYGPQQLDHFRNDLDSLGENTRFYIIEEDPSTRHRTARLNGVVKKWVDWIKKDPRCSSPTAMRSLVDLVEGRLLIADISTARPFQSRRVPTIVENSISETSTPVTPSFSIRAPTIDFSSHVSSSSHPRATAEELDDEMKKILEDSTSATMERVEWIDWNAPAQPGPRRFGARLNTSDSALDQQQNEYRFTPLDDNWKYAPDIDMSHHVLSNTDTRASPLQDKKLSLLCERCSNLQIWLPRLNFSDTLAGLKERSFSCEFCRLLQKHVEGFTGGNHDVIQFFRVGSSLTFHDRQRLPIISLYTLPEQNYITHQESPTDLQNGLSQLHEPGSLAHLQVLSRWINSCDDSHACAPKDKAFLPTRVLEVAKDSDTVRLFCGTRGQTNPGKYIALSHRWGSPEHHHYFCTVTSNIAQHQKGMKISEFPKTFQDAIQITQALNIYYLWIDSLCIIQDDEQDWKTESKLMEQVFSNAYVTIAASCASGTNDGFLKSRPHRDCVRMRKDDGSIVSVCDAIDDFTRDVEQGQLNRRGWVLQERALSRRTIYFTERQTYWECGEGVRCETLTKMNNKKASFLGDASFPESIELYVKGTRIQLFQSLYERYATLDLTCQSDRPIAIRGLEKRLIRTLKTEGGYGVFDCYLHRCLLWQRSNNALERIDTFRSETTPSWSWMAHTGSIKYMNVPFGGVSWAKDIYSPWGGAQSTATGIEGDDTRGLIPSNEIKALAWELVSLCKPGDLVLDDPNRSFTQALKYVIVGTEKLKRPGNKHHKVYVLVVTEVAGAGQGLYERVGVGTLDESMIWWNKPAVDIRLV